MKGIALAGGSGTSLYPITKEVSKHLLPALKRLLGRDFMTLLKHAVKDAGQNGKAKVFGYWVSDPERYGVAEFDRQGNCLSIEEKIAS